VGSCIKLLSLIDLWSFDLSGDKLIDQTAQIIHSEVRGEDIAARIGGDEFADQKMYECKLKKKHPSRIHEFQSK